MVTSGNIKNNLNKENIVTDADKYINLNDKSLSRRNNNTFKNKALENNVNDKSGLIDNSSINFDFT